MRLLAIDPGPTHCGVVLLDVDATILPVVLMANNAMEVDDVCGLVHGLHSTDAVVVEWIESYKVPMKRLAMVLDTARMVGRIEEATRIDDVYPPSFHLMKRPEVALELCQSRSVKDPQLNEAVRSMYREAGMACGGGADPTKGIKKQPGPLYYVSGEHAWSALALGLAWLRREG